MNKYKIDYHPETGPPDRLRLGLGEELAQVLRKIGEVTILPSVGYVTYLDLATPKSFGAVKRHIEKHFLFGGTIVVKHEVTIKGKNDAGNRNRSLSAVA